MAYAISLAQVPTPKQAVGMHIGDEELIPQGAVRRREGCWRTRVDEVMRSVYSFWNLTEEDRRRGDDKRCNEAGRELSHVAKRSDGLERHGFVRWR